MDAEGTIRLADWIKMNSNMTKVSKDLGVTRPTAYKYVKDYDSGLTGSIPEDVLEYFDELLSQDVGAGAEELLRLKDRLAETRERLEEYTKEQLDLIGRCAELESKYYSGGFSMKDEDELNSLRERLRNIDVRIVKDEEVIADLSDVIARSERVGSPALHFKSAYKIQSRCYMEGGRCMVVHDGGYYNPMYGSALACKFVLHLYTVINSEFVRIGTYEHPKDRDFIMIDDVLLSAPLYYTITRLDGIYDDSDFEAGEYTTDISYSTGMCELKQKK